MAMRFSVHTDCADSSIIESIDYFIAEKRVVVTFHTGRAYEYRGIEQSLVKEWMSAPSQGSFFSNFVKNKFPYKEIA